MLYISASAGISARLGAIGAVINGGDVFDAATDGLVDGFMWGGITAWGSAAIQSATRGNLLNGAKPSYKATKDLYRAMSPAEYNSLKSTGKFSSINGSMESEWFATTKADAKSWGKAFYGDDAFKIAKITVPTSSLSNAYYLPKLDGIGAAYCIAIDVLNLIFTLIG